jgi:hypothetical protein
MFSVTPSFTCSCTLGVTYDPAKPGEYQFVENQERCEAHEKVPDDQILDVLYGPKGECRVHTTVLNAMLVPEIELSEDDGKGGRILREDVRLDWWFEGEVPNRKLRYDVSGPSVDQEKLDAIADAVEARHGRDVVEPIDVAAEDIAELSP